MNTYDVAIIGGGPAGLQAALILARIRRRVILFDAPEPPRNAVSHGVHNFVGLDGMTPTEIRRQSWVQIEAYNSTERRTERITSVQPAGDAGFSITGAGGTSITAKHVILALGFRDILPAIAGFKDCWGNTIFSCPYCDGYENRDGVWGMVATSKIALEHMPMIYENWTSQAKFIVSPAVTIDDALRESITARGISIHSGDIIEVHHTTGKVTAVTLDSGETVSVDALWWKPGDAPEPLVSQMIETFALALDEHGFIKTDAHHQTSTPNLWAAGDVRGWIGAIGAAYQGSLAAFAISRQRP